jgi:hypothetical protein
VGCGDLLEALDRPAHWGNFEAALTKNDQAELDRSVAAAWPRALESSSPST